MNLKHYEPVGVFNALSQELDRWMEAKANRPAVPGRRRRTSKKPMATISSASMFQG